MMGKSTGAVFSPCRTYRYALWRIWRPLEPSLIAFIGLNPSTADEVKNDPTVSRCIGMAKRWGYAGMFMLNAFPIRSTDPRGLRGELPPDTPENDLWIIRVASLADRLIFCWGNHAAFMGRSRKVLALLDGQLHKAYHLGLTKRGEPRHPLYLHRRRRTGGIGTDRRVKMRFVLKISCNH